MTKFEPVIGLEVHLQLNTKSKMFCACPSGAKSDLPPNTAICPLCSGQPGALPVINEQAVMFALKAGLALNAQINLKSVFARKNYFYPDLPKGYQISQDSKPIISGGFIETQNADGATKKINIARAHLEEDAGKSMHGQDYSLIDLNRCGVPLLEIVSAPDMRSAAEAYNYLVNLKSIMQWLDISGCDMEKGELRVDVNLSLMPEGSDKFGTRIEIKNLNSFKAVKDALQYEISRQSGILSSGGAITQQTMLWNEDKAVTELMRNKETAQEYRYFPEPDLRPLVLNGDFIELVKKTMPMLPAQKKDFYIKTYGISAYDAALMTSDKDISSYFDEAVKQGATAKPAVNWIGTDILGKLNAENKEISSCPLKPKDLADLIGYIESGKISGKMAKEIFAQAWSGAKAVSELVESSGASQVNDEAQLEIWAKEAIAENPKAAADIKAGNSKAIGALVGSVMKKSKGKANPALLNKIFIKLIS
ncbi:MAG: Asp-tRNA(Asn)/Glu-tRNA(Gln) amidotransferase subunit GatB [Elusimicrobiota bacterium]|jgi:aspartyl-tRNA(Asn)/glutamyl-tRNA(Gln) amidotransferase subunit B|nr:Asp-tRNA(Asn)/Glu-tRNA(Gln) amidotransferase subunit GatB [Elusimicrobiota bacterium]